MITEQERLPKLTDAKVSAVKVVTEGGLSVMDYDINVRLKALKMIRDENHLVVHLNKASYRHLRAHRESLHPASLRWMGWDGPSEGFERTHAESQFLKLLGACESLRDNESQLTPAFVAVHAARLRQVQGVFRSLEALTYRKPDRPRTW